MGIHHHFRPLYKEDKYIDYLGNRYTIKDIEKEGEEYYVLLEEENKNIKKISYKEFSEILGDDKEGTFYYRYQKQWK